MIRHSVVGSKKEQHLIAGKLTLKKITCKCVPTPSRRYCNLISWESDLSIVVCKIVKSLLFCITYLIHSNESLNKLDKVEKACYVFRCKSFSLLSIYFPSTGVVEEKEPDLGMIDWVINLVYSVNFNVYML